MEQSRVDGSGGSRQQLASEKNEKHQVNATMAFAQDARPRELRRRRP